LFCLFPYSLRLFAPPLVYHQRVWEHA
jgi:hypothetical protein